MKQIEVVAAIIRKGDKIFATQRRYGDWKDWWEFPGGKMKAGETPEEALESIAFTLNHIWLQDHHAKVVHYPSMDE